MRFIVYAIVFATSSARASNAGGMVRSRPVTHSRTTITTPKPYRFISTTPILLI
jgi:hypothetical protein